MSWPIVFWIVCSALALGVAALLARAALSGRAPGGQTPATYDIRIYRDQLAEVERDLARGTLPESEAGRLRTEISRRLLAADTQARRGDSAARTSGPGPAVTVAGAALVFVLAIGLYTQLGQPDYPDMPRAGRIEAARAALGDLPAQASIEDRLGGAISYADQAQGVSPDFMELMEQLRGTVAERPEDERGFRLLARNEAVLGNFKAGYEAQQQAIALAGARASGQDHADLADMMILSAGGRVSEEAAQALRTALARDPGNGAANYYMGLLMVQTGRPDVAFRLWDRLLQVSPPDAPWITPIRAQIMEVAQRAGEQRYQLPDLTTPAMPAMPGPDGLAGPSAADIEAAGDMSAEDRAQMVRGMVDSLSSRLANQGGSAAEWARLISALGVLGETDRARAIFQEAEQTFAANPDELQLVRQAAQQAGVAP